MFNGAPREGMEVVLEGGRIASIGESRGEVNLPNRLVMPGFVNAHSHAFQRGIRGWVQHAVGEDNFWSWRDRMYGLANSLDPDGIEAVSRLAFLEMVEAGFTSVGEFHYLHHQPDGTPWDDPNELSKRVISAARDVGLRINLLRVAYARAGAGKGPAPGQRRFCDPSAAAVLKHVDDLISSDAVTGDDAVTVGLAPHSVRAVPSSWLSEFASFDGVIHAHVDEQGEEIDQCLGEYGLRPIEVFSYAGLLNPRFTAVHLTWPDNRELQLLRRSGAGVCGCPTTELDLGDGFLQVEYLDGVNLSIGSDSHARIDPFAEMRALEWHARARLGRRNVMVASEDPSALAARLAEIGSLGGARALGLDTGELRVGAMADLIAIDLDHTALATGPVLPNVIFSGGPELVREAWVGGRQLLEGGRHPGRREIIEAANRALQAAR